MKRFRTTVPLFTVAIIVVALSLVVGVVQGSTVRTSLRAPSIKFPLKFPYAFNPRRLASVDDLPRPVGLGQSIEHLKLFHPVTSEKH